MFDLHTHSTASDGGLSPHDLLKEALANGVTTLAITDHDTLAAHRRLHGLDHDLHLVAGVEWSTTLDGVDVHLLSLNVDPDHPCMTELEAEQLQSREDRGQRIAHRLTKAGVEGAWEGALRVSGGSVVGRNHFARWMVESGVVSDHQQAFKRYLGKGSRAFVSTHWAAPETIIAATRNAGGQSVLAHPLDYRLTATRLRRLLDAYVDLGGDGVEVVNGFQNRDRTTFLAELIRARGLLASAGSDFHFPSPRGRRPGYYSRLPDGLEYVWSHW